MHLNFQFFGMEAMETFACYDVMKNPSIEKDFERFTAHLEKHFPNRERDAVRAGLYHQTG